MRKVLELIENRYLAYLPYLLGALTLFFCSAFLAGALLFIRASRPDTPPITATATVIVFETAHCETCDAFRSQIGKPHQGSELAQKAPLRYYDASEGSTPRRYTLARSIDDAPIAVVFDIYGREQARVTGVPDTLADFQRRLLPHIKRAERDYEFAQSQGLAR
jgi:hypothetical protein